MHETISLSDEHKVGYPVGRCTHPIRSQRKKSNDETEPNRTQEGIRTKSAENKKYIQVHISSRKQIIYNYEWQL